MLSEWSNTGTKAFLKVRKINYRCRVGLRNQIEEAKKWPIGAVVHSDGYGMIFVNWLELNKSLEGKEDQKACKKLRCLLSIPNSNVSDSIANMLMVEAVLRDRDMSMSMFKELFRETPS